MKVITPQEESRVMEVLVKAFRNVPGALWVVKKSGNQEERLRVLCRHCLRVSMQKKGAYISSDGNGVALIFNNKARVNFLNWLIWYLQLGTFCIGWDRALKMITRENKIVKMRQAREHLYFWMIAVNDHSNGLNTIIEIRDFVFKLSKQLQLPILAETTVKKNLNLYQRYGFKIYDEWDTRQNEIKVWFLCREWNV